MTNSSDICITGSKAVHYSSYASITSCPKFHPTHFLTPTPWKVFQSSLSCPLVIFHAAHLPLLFISYMPTPDSLASALHVSRGPRRGLYCSSIISVHSEASEGGASRCLGLLAEVSTVLGPMICGLRFVGFDERTYVHW
jgi:hypothetical protein